MNWQYLNLSSPQCIFWNAHGIFQYWQRKNYSSEMEKYSSKNGKIFFQNGKIFFQKGEHWAKLLRETTHFGRQFSASSRGAQNIESLEFLKYLYQDVNFENINIAKGILELLISISKKSFVNRKNIGIWKDFAFCEQP